MFFQQPPAELPPEENNPQEPSAEPIVGVLNIKGLQQPLVKPHLDV